MRSSLKVTVVCDCYPPNSCIFGTEINPIISALYCLKSGLFLMNHEEYRNCCPLNSYEFKTQINPIIIILYCLKCGIFFNESWRILKIAESSLIFFPENYHHQSSQCLAHLGYYIMRKQPILHCPVVVLVYLDTFRFLYNSEASNLNIVHGFYAKN
jgi:hypothetical protein